VACTVSGVSVLLAADGMGVGVLLAAGGVGVRVVSEPVRC
jgi:hypothetical protein